MPAHTDTPQSDSQSQPPTKRHRFRLVRLILLLIITALVSLCEPRIFQLVARKLLGLEAWRNGITLRGAAVESSLFEPFVVTGIRFHSVGPTGNTTHMEIERLEAQLDPKALLRGNAGRMFQRLSLSGIVGTTVFPETPTPKIKTSGLISELRALPKRLKTTGGKWWQMPSLIELRQIEYTWEKENSGDSVHLERSQLIASPLEPGVIQIGRLTLKQPWLTRTFRDVRGTTAIQGSDLTLAELLLEPDVEIVHCSADLDSLVSGHLDLEMKLAAFGGQIRIGRTQATRQTEVHFTQISVGKLASFLHLSDAAGGTIKEGNFNFPGSLSKLEKATARLWLDATNFQWESRQWDSLALGANLADGRIEVYKLNLQQGRNRINLSGEMALPLPGIKWWQTEFTCNVAATVEDLTQFSALVLPEFKFAAGKLKIDGSVRGRNQLFNGALIASGSQLRWRNAPIENLHAAVRLEGNECQISNLELFNNGDFVRGRGVVNIVGASQYWGELSASISDLATYSAILQKPLVPEPMAGRALIDWSGEGSAKGHSGKFLAQLNKVRSLGASAGQLHPINVNMEGSYTLGNIQFSTFALWDDESSMTANVGVGKKALSLQKILLTHGKKIALEGDALLPLDIWQRWPNTSLAELLDDGTVCQIRLKANGLDLRQASQLSGWNVPVSGTLNGTLAIDGPVAALKSSGTLVLSRGQLPVGWNYGALTDIEATALFEDEHFTLTKFTAKSGGDPFQIHGSVSLRNPRDPELQLALETASLSVPIFGADRPNPIVATASLDLTLNGPLSAPTLKGEALIHKLVLPAQIELDPFWNDELVNVPPLFPTTASRPWSRWNFDVALRTPATLTTEGNPGTTVIDARVNGTGGLPLWAGTLRLNGLKATSGHLPMRIASAIATFAPQTPAIPTLDAQLQGDLLGQSFSIHLAGPLQKPLKWAITEPPLTAELLGKALAGETLESPIIFERSMFELRSPSVFTPEALVYPWTQIFVLPVPPPQASIVTPSPLPSR